MSLTVHPSAASCDYYIGERLSEGIGNYDMDTLNTAQLWDRYNKYFLRAEHLGLSLDVSRMRFDEAFFDRMKVPFAEAFSSMALLEGGAHANADEDRMVGHYWLRQPSMAPSDDMRQDIEQTVEDIKRFARDVHDGAVKPKTADGFYVTLLIGIGGSALGPQFVCDALGTADDPMIVRFIDNTDPDGMDRILDELSDMLGQTLTVVVSKSGGTVETHNAMLEVKKAYEQAGLSFAEHAVAITCKDSQLDKLAQQDHWLRTFPMWDWVGGRTSVLSAAGLLPVALQGVDIDALLRGARECDVLTRGSSVLENPAALLAAMWHYAGDGRGTRDMVVLPYCDRLAMFGKYLQQLVMESIGKSCDRDGQQVHQGLTVYGNKGSTDQHAFVQQLQEGPGDFFVTFIEVLQHRSKASIMVSPDVTAGDYLDAFLHGTRNSLYNSGRDSLTITLDHLDARSLGALIALFERAVGLYAELIHVNAYHQPGVEHGKKAAGETIKLQALALQHMRTHADTAWTCQALADAIDRPEAVEALYHILRHIASNPDHGITIQPADTPALTHFQAS